MEHKEIAKTLLKDDRIYDIKIEFNWKRVKEKITNTSISVVVFYNAEWNNFTIHLTHATTVKQLLDLVEEGFNRDYVVEKMEENGN